MGPKRVGPVGPPAAPWPSGPQPAPMVAVLLPDMLEDDVLVPDMLPQAASRLMRPVAMMSFNMMSSLVRVASGRESAAVH